MNGFSGLDGRPPGGTQAAPRAARVRNGCCVMRSELPPDPSDLCGRRANARVTSGSA